MFSILDRGGVSRRELLRVGGLGALGLSLPALLAARAGAADSVRGSTFGRAKNVIFLWLQGGPPQHETFDPKPDAPAEIRGEFRPIDTNVPGVRICELLPRIAGICDKLAIVRSLCTHTDLHDASGYWVLTGTKYVGAQSRQISPTDWPYLGSIVKLLRPSEKLPAYSSVWLPDVMRLNDNVQPAGQTAGWLGRRWEPERVVCDPSGPEFKMEGLALPKDVPPLRLSGRESLLAQLDRHFAGIEESGVLREHAGYVHDAFELLKGGRAHAAFDVSREPHAVRDRYGRGKWGQCVLLARRLVEAGARLVHVNWPREGGDSAVDNPMWDTHAQNADRVQDVLCPQLDISLTALIEDLDQRGLLDETLVVAVGEFGRTPKINALAGRDHWGHVFSYVLAGAGIRTAQVHGSSDRDGAYPATGKHEPQDLTATIYHLLGIPHDAIYPNLGGTGRSVHVTTGEPLDILLGDGPATPRRQVPTGNTAFVPPFSDALLLNVAFRDDAPLQAAGSGNRLKGWQATPLEGPLRAVLAPGEGVSLGAFADQDVALADGSGVLLAQEIRNFRAGHYAFAIRAAVGGAAPELFARHFACRLVIYRHTDAAKNVLKRKDEVSVPFVPEAGAPVRRFELTRLLDSRAPGVNFAVGLGFGAAVIVEKKPGAATLPAGATAFLKVESVELVFTPRTRNDDVMV